MKKYHFTLLLSMLLSVSCSEADMASPPENSTQSLQQNLNRVIEAVARNEDFMGSITLMQTGDIIYSHAVGYDNIASQKASSVNSKYRIGSISKTYTAVLIFSAIEESKLALEQSIDVFFPTLKNATSIRIVDLLQHRSGIPNFTKDELFFTYHTQFKSKQEMLNMLLNYDRDFVPNSKAEYSNSNYFLLAYILEQIYNTDYGTLLKNKITVPLELKDTYQGDKVSLSNNESYSYRYQSAWQRLPETDMSITLGAGSIVSTSQDVAKFMHSLFNGQIISRESVEKMMSIKDDFGMGLVRYKLTDRLGFGHRGTLDGYKATAIYFPAPQVTLVITSNGSNDNLNVLFVDVLKAYFDDAPIAISIDELENYTGVYQSSDDNSDDMVFIRDKTTLVHVIKEQFKEPLIYKGHGRFIFEQMYAESMTFTFSGDGNELHVEQGSSRSKVPLYKMQIK